MGPALLGRRVMVRFTGADGRLTDAVGDLLAWRDGRLVVRTRSGQVSVPQAAVVAGKPVPEPRLRHAREASVAQLTRIAARARPPLESAWVGGWLLRAGEPPWLAGTVLPLGEPDPEPEHGSLDGTLAAVTGWYRQRGRTAAVHLAGPEAGELDRALADRGWPATAAHVVLVADLPADRGLAAGGADWAVLDGVAAASASTVRGAAEAALERAATEGARHALVLVRTGDEDSAGSIIEALAELGFAEHHRCHLRQAAR